MSACMASGDQWEQALRQSMRVCAGTPGAMLLLAITEYNAAFVQDTPKPYRFTTAWPCSARISCAFCFSRKTAS